MSRDSADWERSGSGLNGCWRYRQGRGNQTRETPNRVHTVLLGVTSELAIADPRRRLLDAAALVHAERGYSDMEISEVLERAGVSREVFYENFVGKLDCIAVVQEIASERLRTRMVEAWASSQEWPNQVRASVTAGLEFASETPELASTLLPTSLVLEPVLARGVWAMSDFLAAAMRTGSSDYPGAHRPPEVAEQVLIGGVQALIVARMRSGQSNHLPELATEMTQTLLMPFLGPSEAEKFARAPEE